MSGPRIKKLESNNQGVVIQHFIYVFCVTQFVEAWLMKTCVLEYDISKTMSLKFIPTNIF